MKKAELRWLIVSWIALFFISAAAISQPDAGREIGHSGGQLVISQRAEPKTLNPVTAVDGSSREIIGLITADLIHINRFSQRTEAALASSWTVSSGGRQYTLRLRHGVRFSDGHPFDADDVIFTFEVYLDESIHSPQRELLVISGKPIAVRRINAYTVQFELAQPYAAAERLFDSIAILPRHLLKKLYDEKRLAGAWGLTTPPDQIAGLGPFQLKQYIPGQRLVLEPNPYYWKADQAGHRLPYLHQIVSLFVGNPEAESMRFEAGEIDVVNRLSSANFAALAKYQQARGFRLYDLGPGLEYDFLFFNLNGLTSKNLSSIARKQLWFRQLAFRRAVSTVIDRKGIVRMVYDGRACALSAHVTPGNRLWVNRNIPQSSRNVAAARAILRKAGFSWSSDGHLMDARQNAVEFSILHNAGNSQQMEMATIIQEDLKEVGIEVRLVSIEFRTMLDRIFKTYEYEAAIMALAGGDSDPNSEMNVWTSQGSTHVWNLTPNHALAPWEAEIDRLMQEQLVALDYQQRKRMYDRVQELVWENLPVICLVSPNILVGAKKEVGNFCPAILSHHTLWNAEELFFHRPERTAESP
jgi:peptide/nickel transport system substrate-binding protein